MPLTRKQLKEALDTVPMDRVLGIPGQLTHKQREFARLVASGEKGASAYRKTYSDKGKNKTQGDCASRLKRDPRIAAEIEAYRLANEAAAYRTPQQLRDLVIHSLVQVVIDPDAKHAQKVQAAKVLGTVTEVAAFTERRELTVHRSSEDAKRMLMDKLRELMNAGATDVEARDVDALERELRDPGAAVESAAAQEADPTPQDGVWSPASHMHSTPHPRSDQNSDPPPPSIFADDFGSESMETPPGSDEDEKRGGGA